VIIINYTLVRDTKKEKDMARKLDVDELYRRMDDDWTERIGRAIRTASRKYRAKRNTSARNQKKKAPK